MSEEALKKDEYLNQFVEVLKEEFREEDWKYEVNMEMGYLKMEYQDAYQYEEIFIDLNEYNVPVKATITRASLDEEIVTPESCHECFEECPYYSEDECKITDENIDKEIEEWEKVLVEKGKLVVKRVIVELECFLDVRHYHLLKGYEVVLKDSLLPDTVKALDELFDVIVEVAEP
jgi:hypothetical protein